MLPASFCGLQMPQEELKHVPKPLDLLHARGLSGAYGGGAGHLLASNEQGAGVQI